jgi:acetylornithine/N-succinyldiaminopimelate aminotransferase
VKECSKRDILVVFDEVQSGTGRTGSFFAHSAFGVKADIVTMAKGLAGGVPVGATLAGDKAATVLGVGDHGSTFGGNPLAAAAGLVVLDKLSDNAFLREIAALGDYLMAGLRALPAACGVREVRGRGLMAAADINKNAWDVLVALVERAKHSDEGLLVLSAGEKTLRFLPPYIITRAEIDRGLSMLAETLAA